MSILEIRRVSKDFGGLKAVDKVDFEVHRGEIMGIIGPNGAGKTTLLNLVTGFLKPAEGSIVYKGESLDGLKPHVIAQKGLVRTFQLTSLFSNLTVLDNIVTAHHLRIRSGVFDALFSRRGLRDEEREIRQKSLDLLAFSGLEGKQDLIAKTLPFGDQRKLEIAIALASEPELLLLDEPATGMNPTETNKVMDLIQLVRQKGITILLVEHNMKLVMNICERIAVLDFGVKIAEGTPEEISKSSDVIAIYLGREKGAEG